MSAAVLLAPGDVIRDSLAELKERQIQVHIKEWQKEGEAKTTEKIKTESGKEEEKEEEDKSTEKGKEKQIGEVDKERKEESKQKEEKAKKEKKEDSVVGEEVRAAKAQHAKPNQNVKKEKESSKEEEKREKDQASNAETDRGTKSGTGVGSEFATERGGDKSRKDGREGGGRVDVSNDGGDGNVQRGWVVLTSEIARAISSKYGTNVGVYDEKSLNVIYIDKPLQKVLDFSREMSAEQTEMVREVRKRRGKGDGKLVIDEVMSMKKLQSMIGGLERKADVVRARDTSVMLVSNDEADLERATAYFTAPTGDKNWKEVARKAAMKGNIMAYTSTGTDAKSEFLHLIDHL